MALPNTKPDKNESNKAKNELKVNKTKIETSRAVQKQKRLDLK